jgi:ATP-dependent Clp protease protease subunit
MARGTKRDTFEVFFEQGIDLANRTMLVWGAVDEELLKRTVMGLHVLGTSGPICILLNSTGGDVEPGLAIYDVISRHDSPITIRVIGEALSMGCVILQAGDIREATERSSLLYHVGEESYGPDHPHNIKALMQFRSKLDDMIDNIMLDRINEKHPDEPWSMAKFRKNQLFDRYLTAEEAVELGLIDRIWRG